MPEAPNNHYLCSKPNRNSQLDDDNRSNTNIVKVCKNNGLKYIEDVTNNADEIQERVLAQILSSSANVEYLQRHGLDGRTDKETFKKIIPVVTYEDLKPDIDRIANGDTSPILCSKPISEFLTSSGTSGGERKLMPTIEDEQDRRSLLYSLLMPVMNQFVTGLDKGKGMYFLFIKPESKTPGGLLARPVLTSYYKSSHFKAGTHGHDPSTDYTSPIETILCLDSYQSMYSQLLCGLCQNEQVLRAGAVFASGFIRVIKFLENHWVGLCNDIRNGTINAEINDSSVREAIMKILKSPNPKLADFIEAECKKESWKGIITRLWPNIKYADVIVTGTMSQYIPVLDYYSNGLPLVSHMYGSSECYFGLNLNPLCEPSEVSYTLIPTMAYFEFLPLNKINGHTDSISSLEQEHLADLVDVELGQEYELVITTYAGLYRYRVGDILRVAGFKNKAPQFNFVCRKNVVLSIDSDKTGEVELQNSVKNGGNHLEQFGATLIDYTSCADTSTIPGHYALYWEISMKDQTPIPASVFEECCYAVEGSLNSVYRQSRVSKSIGPLEIKIVENGTFDKLMDFALSQGASINQYKTPRCVKYAPILELLNSKTVSNYFSPKCPGWVPGHKKWCTLD